MLFRSVKLVDAKHDAKKPLVERCTYALVWTESASANREGTALALAVQPLDAWRELWLFRKSSDGWSVVSRRLPRPLLTETPGWPPSALSRRGAATRRRRLP